MIRYCCILQDNQRDLEQATEHLSEYLERDITSDMLVDVKQKVQDKYRCEFHKSTKSLLFQLGDNIQQNGARLY